MAIIANTILVPVLVAVLQSLRVSQGEAYVEQAWFEPGGVIFTAITLVIIDFAAQEPMQVVMIAPIMGIIKSKFAMFGRSYASIAKLLEPPEMLIGNMYAFLASTTTLCMLYAPFYPPIFLISAICIFVGYGCSKFAICKWYRRPSNLDEEMMEQMRSVLEFVLLIHVGSLYLAGFNASFSYPVMPTYAAVGLWVSYMLADSFLLHHFELFADYNQLDEGGDTGDLRYDEVESKLGYEIKKYASPHVESIEELEEIFDHARPDRIGYTDGASANLVAAVEYCALVKEPWKDTLAGKPKKAGPADADEGKKGDYLGTALGSITTEFKDSAKELV